MLGLMHEPEISPTVSCPPGMASCVGAWMEFLQQEVQLGGVLRIDTHTALEINPLSYSDQGPL